MTNGLKLLFGAILLGMLSVTVAAGLEQGLVTAGRELWPNPWFRATLADAYFGFLTFYAWVFYKERSRAGRVLWFLLIVCLGNIAMSAYMLLTLHRLPAGARVEDLLLRRPA